MPVVILDQVHWAQLEQVQLQVDHQVRYTTDMERFGVPDWWEPATDRGDCEDIVLTKRQKLMDMGWPAEALRIAVVIDGHGDLHALLTVDVTMPNGAPATYALDSHFERVEPWDALSQYGYTWLERSKPGSTQWTRLDNGGVAANQQIALLAATIMPASPRWEDNKVSPRAASVVVKLERPAPAVQEIRVAAPAQRPIVLDAQVASLSIGAPAATPKAVASVDAEPAA
jgi:predicted transglutaminase-like cysteine proteinase